MTNDADNPRSGLGLPHRLHVRPRDRRGGGAAGPGGHRRPEATPSGPTPTPPTLAPSDVAELPGHAAGTPTTLGPRFAEVIRRRYGDAVAEGVVERFGADDSHPMVVRHPVTGPSAPCS